MRKSKRKLHLKIEGEESSRVEKEDEKEENEHWREGEKSSGVEKEEAKEEEE